MAGRVGRWWSRRSGASASRRQPFRQRDLAAPLELVAPATRDPVSAPDPSPHPAAPRADPPSRGPTAAAPSSAQLRGRGRTPGGERSGPAGGVPAVVHTPRSPPWPGSPEGPSCSWPWLPPGSGPEPVWGDSDDRTHHLTPHRPRPHPALPRRPRPPPDLPARAGAGAAGVSAAVPGEPFAGFGVDSRGDPAGPGAAVAAEAGGGQRDRGAAAGWAAGGARRARAGRAGGGGRGGGDRAGRGGGAGGLPDHLPDRGHGRAGRGRPSAGRVRADAPAGAAVPRPAPVG